MPGVEAAAVTAGARMITPTVKEVGKKTSNYFLRNYRYVKHIEKNWKELQDYEENLKNKMTFIEGELENNSSIKKETEECKTWRRRVRDIIDEIQKLRDGYRNKPPTSFCGLCPFCPLRRLGRSIVKKKDEATDKLNAWSMLTIMQDKPTSTPHDSKWKNVVETVMHESLKSNVATLLKWLKKERFQRISIWGPPGVGKTTTMKIVQEKITKSGCFDIIFYVSATAKNIQEEICRGLNMINSTEISEEEREKKYLLFLDDVTSEVNVRDLLNKAGIGFYNERGKLVLACRDKPDYETDEDLHVQPLTQEDATKLFWNAVGSEMRGSDFQEIANKIIKLCAGVPPLLNLIGKHLRRKEIISEWRNMETYLKSTSQQKWQELEEYYWSFKRVYDQLDPSDNQQARGNGKNCLLYWSIFPFDEEVNRDHAIDCWTVEKFLNCQKLWDARDRGHDMLYLFTAKCLVEKGEREHYKMSVLFQRAPLRIANEERSRHIFAQYGEGTEKFEWKEATRVSLGPTLQFSLPENPKCSRTLTLSIQANSLKKFPRKFFADMHDLQVLCLIQTGIVEGQTGIVELPSSISKLKKLKGLFLYNCHGLVQLPQEIEALYDLEILVLHQTGIYYLPKKIGKLSNLKCLRVSFKESPNQNHVPAGTMIPPGVIRKLSKLEELTLDVRRNITAWNQIDDVIAREITTLGGLTHLHFYFSQMDSFQYFLENSKSWAGNGQCFRSFNFIVGEQRNSPASDFKVFQCSAEKHFKFSGGRDRFPNAVSMALKRATSFELIGHGTALSLTNDLVPDAPDLDLEAFTVEECQEMKSIVNVGDNTRGSPASASRQPSVFQCLKELHIRKLQKLESIWQGEIASRNFSALTTLTLKECPSITVLFSPRMVSRLPKLQNLQVEDCESIESIIRVENSGELVAFESLKEFQLSNLPSLFSICDARLVLPSLESLEKILIRTCEMLLSLPQILEYASKFSEIHCEEAWWSQQDWSRVPQEFIAETSEAT